MANITRDMIIDILADRLRNNIHVEDENDIQFYDDAVNDNYVEDEEEFQDFPPGVQGPSRGQHQIYVTIPRGVLPGQHFAVLVNGRQMMIRCPPGHGENDRLIVTAPRQLSHQYVVTVPPNIRPGEQFRIQINSQEVMVTCPRGVHAGQRVTFQLPEPERTQAPTPTPNHQVFEVAVPENVRPGQPFALTANAQRVMVTCPPNAKAGQKIRFQLPIQLSEFSADQLEAIKVNYDKKGWMRCLNQELKFYWVYNSSDKYAKAKVQHINQFNIEGCAFVRQFSSDKKDLSLIPASEYAIETTVKGTSVNYSELSSVSVLPFEDKSDWLRNQFNALRIPWDQGHIKIKVQRSNFLVNAMEAIESIAAADMHKTFRFEFIKEPGLDAGGLAREFYQLVAEFLFNPDFGLFLYSPMNPMRMQINPISGMANELHLKYFHFAGRVLGKALMDNHLPAVHLIQPIYKHLMGWPVTLHDLEHIDDQVYRNLLNLLGIDDVSLLHVDFSVSEDNLGVQDIVNLVPNGTDKKALTKENLPEYLEAQLKYHVLERVKPQLRELLMGFYDVVPEPLLAVFDYQELELVMHGLAF